MSPTLHLRPGPKRSVNAPDVPSFLRLSNRPFLRQSAEHERATHLMPRHVEVIRLIGEFAYSNKEIATTLGIAEGTVKQYVSQLLALLGLNNRTEVYAYYQAQNPSVGIFPLVDNNVRMGAFE